MSRRIDLRAKHDNSFHMNRDLHPFLNEEEFNNNENDSYDDSDVESNSYDEYEEYYDNESYDDNYDDVNNNPRGKSGIRNTISNAINKNKTSNALNGIKQEASNEVKAEAVKVILKNPVVKKVLLIAIPVVIFVLLIAFLIAAVVSENNNKGLATGGYYAMRCPEVTVIFVDKSNGYSPIGTETYPFEEYIEGVLRGEVSSLNNIEIYKEYAILARTYFLTHDDNCTIEASDRKQVFKTYEDNPYYADKIHQAVEETRGQVLLQNNELKSVQYDAFCSIAVDSNYYTIKQMNQKIPRSWVDSQRGIAESWKQGNCAGNHGNGVSTWGSYYLVTEQGFKYDEVLKYYLGDDIMISRGGFMSSIEGLEIKDNSGTAILYQPLSSFLPSRGSSIAELNAFIHDSVTMNGSGSRAGVVTAAVSLINFLNDVGGVRLPYYWGGNWQDIGVNPNFGGITTPSAHKEIHAGFDCSGFVSWAIYNGGYNLTRLDTRGFESRFGSDGCFINESDCIGQPGDLINESGVHVQLIVSVDETSGQYYIAESSYGLTMHTVGMHAGSSNRKIIHMDNYYNNPANVNYNY